MPISAETAPAPEVVERPTGRRSKRFSTPQCILISRLSIWYSRSSHPLHPPLWPHVASHSFFFLFLMHTAQNIGVQCNKWCVFTACSFPLSNSQQKERTEGERGKGIEKETEWLKQWGERERRGWLSERRGRAGGECFCPGEKWPSRL